MKTPEQFEIKLYKDKTISKRETVFNDRDKFKYVLIDSIKEEILGYSSNKEILLKNKLNAYDVAIRRALMVLKNPFYKGIRFK